MAAGQSYALYFAGKTWLLGICMLVLALVFRPAINGQYNPTTCAACNQQAKSQPQTMFEFGVCAKTYTPNLQGPNLLMDAFSPHGSPVAQMLCFSIVTLTLALAYCILLYIRWDTPLPSAPAKKDGPVAAGPVPAAGEFTQGAVTSIYNVLMTVIWVMGAQFFFQLYLSGKCYVSPWSSGLLFIAFIANVTVLAPALLYSIFRLMLGKDEPWLLTAICFWLNVVVIVAYLGFNFYLAVGNMRTTGSWTHLAVVSALVLACVAEVVIMWRSSKSDAEGYTTALLGSKTTEQKARSTEHQGGV